MTRMISYILGVVMTLAGLLGFAMNGSVLGVFTAGSALAALWVAAGVITLVVTVWAPGSVVLWAKIAGIVLAVLGVLGLVMSGLVLGVLDNTPADNWLHVALAVLFLWVGFMPAGRAQEPASSTPPSQPAM